MTDAFASVRVIKPIDGVGTSYLHLETPDGWLRFDLLDDGMEPLTLRARYNANATDTDLQSQTYSPAAHAYLRIRDDGDRLVWETSADGVTFAVFASVQPAPFEVSEVTVKLGGITQQPNPDPNLLIFDDFNIVPR